MANSKIEEVHNLGLHANATPSVPAIYHKIIVLEVSEIIWRENIMN
jgi:hypothetical protein